MKVLVTFPGRCGDLIWALPSVRALSETLGQPVDLHIAGEFAGMVPLLSRQPYLGRIFADPSWNMSGTWDPQLPPEVAVVYDRVFHLGYRRWPELPLPLEAYQNLLGQCTSDDGLLLAPDLTRPWITVPPADFGVTPVWVEGWTETWFELKIGLSHLLYQRFKPYSTLRFPVNISSSGRWASEQGLWDTAWEVAAQWIKAAPVFLGDCSALHVLAVALGVPVLLCEPMEARHNPIFYPLGKIGPQVTLVTGNDGLPTFDARHVGDALKGYLR